MSVKRVKMHCLRSTWYLPQNADWTVCTYLKFTKLVFHIIFLIFVYNPYSAPMVEDPLPWVRIELLSWVSSLNIKKHVEHVCTSNLQPCLFPWEINENFYVEYLKKRGNSHSFSHLGFMLILNRINN